MSPEQRRFLGTPRGRREAASLATGASEERAEPAPRPGAKSPARPSEAKQSHSSGAERDELEHENERRVARETEARISSPLLRQDQSASRLWELRRAIVILGALALLGLTFFVGLKFPYWKYRLFASRSAPKLEGAAAKEFANISPDELIEEALVAQRAGKYPEAAERFLAAKRKNLGYRGILARVGKLAYDRKDFETADKLFERATAFGENVGQANFFRGMIAVRRSDLAAARRFFETAAAAEPFISDYPYNLAEALRLDHRPLESVPIYRHASLLVQNDGEAAICRFKIRMARLEAAEGAKVKDELAAQQSGGKLSADWLMTAAAVHIREGQLDEAGRLRHLRARCLFCRSRAQIPAAGGSLPSSN